MSTDLWVQYSIVVLTGETSQQTRRGKALARPIKKGETISTVKIEGTRTRRRETKDANYP